jgi:imidazolonepropionase-like amidohydrolase
VARRNHKFGSYLVNQAMTLRDYKILLLFLLFTLCCAAVKAQVKSATVFRNVTVIDMTGEQPKPNITVIVRGSRIAEIGVNLQIPKKAEVVDASGKFLIPGLWDMHTHMFNNITRVGTSDKEINFPLFIANGVTSVRDMFSDAEDIKLARQWNAEINAGTTIGPRVFVSSTIVDGVPTFIPDLPQILGVKNAAEGRAAVRSLKASGAGFIKVYWTLSPEAYFAIADESKKQNITFAGHVPFSVSAFDASDAGQKSIEHLTGIEETCSSKEDELRKKEWTPAVQEEMIATYDEKKCLNLFKRFAKNKTYQVPTAILHRGLALYDDEGFQDNPGFKYVSKETLKEWADSPQLSRGNNLKIRRQRFEWLLETIGKMHRANVPLLAGTDNNNPYVVPGFALHDELELFVQAGLTPMKALKTATVNAAEYLGMEKFRGTIEKGKFADLVLLDANPLIDISNIRKINAVVINGRLLKRKELDEMLNKIAAKAK